MPVNTAVRVVVRSPGKAFIRDLLNFFTGLREEAVHCLFLRFQSSGEVRTQDADCFSKARTRKLFFFKNRGVEQIGLRRKSPYGDKQRIGLARKEVDKSSQRVILQNHSNYLSAFCVHVVSFL